MESLYDAVGGQTFFEQLVRNFYQRVEHDPVLRPLYPSELDDSRHWLTLFLAQYFGGPGAYSESKGHPRLRMRHGHLKIGRNERDAWWNAMAAALDQTELVEPYKSAMLEYFTTSADWMINHDDQATTET